MKLGIRALYKTSLEKRELRENSAVSFLLYLRVNLIFALNFVFINRVWFDSTPKRLLPSIQESDFSGTSLLTMVVGVISCYSELLLSDYQEQRISNLLRGASLESSISALLLKGAYQSIWISWTKKPLLHMSPTGLIYCWDCGLVDSGHKQPAALANGM